MMVVRLNVVMCNVGMQNAVMRIVMLSIVMHAVCHYALHRFTEHRIINCSEYIKFNAGFSLHKFTFTISHKTYKQLLKIVLILKS
jgi:hypothetical protein